MEIIGSVIYNGSKLPQPSLIIHHGYLNVISHQNSAHYSSCYCRSLSFLCLLVDIMRIGYNPVSLINTCRWPLND